MFNLFKKDDIGEPPWDYNFLVNLDEKEYPKYLAKIFKYTIGEKLPLKWDFKQQAWVIDKKRCKTFNQKLQWLKLYGVTDLMRKCTDKAAVRDYVAEKIGSEYLKPVLQIIPAQSLEYMHNSPPLEGCLEETGWSYQNYFDQINWDKLPNAFVIKCNHGSKWQYIIKDKEQFLNNPQLFDIVKRNITGWLEQEYFPWNGFEMQYKGIKPKILIEPLMRDEINTEPDKINVYCFNGKPKIFIKFFEENKMSIWDENFEPMDNIFNFLEENIKTKVNDYINQTFDLCNQLLNIDKANAPCERRLCDGANTFEFVRIDWMIYQNKLYFEEFTFTPYSGFIKCKKINI